MTDGGARIDPMAGRRAVEWDATVDVLPDPPTVWPPPGRLVLVAPHPDDELLATGATLAAASDAGTGVTVVAATDGEWSHPYLNAAGRAGLADRRTVESAAAYEAAGIRAERVRLSLPDGGLAGRLDELVERLTPLLVGAATCVAPRDGDGHPDHDACAVAARRAGAAAGVPVVGVPIWSWNWDDPASPAMPLDGAFAHRFDAATLARKQAGIACYASQVLSEDGNRPVLPASFLAHFARPVEVFLPPQVIGGQASRHSSPVYGGR